MKKILNDSATQYLRSLEKPLTESLQKQAMSKGWPKNLAMSLSVVIDSNRIYVKYPDALATVIEDLEYGSKVDSPIPVLRFFIEKNQTPIANKLAEWSVNHMISTGVLP